MSWIVLNAVALTCIVAACVAAVYGVEGWGWFLLVALLTTISPAGKS